MHPVHRRGTFRANAGYSECQRARASAGASSAAPGMIDTTRRKPLKYIEPVVHPDQEESPVNETFEAVKTVIGDVLKIDTAEIGRAHV